MVQLFYDFFYFVKNPSTLIGKPFEKITIKNFAVLFVVSFCFQGVLQYLISIITLDNIQSAGYAMTNSYLWTFWNSVIAAPFLEELEFRFGLKSKSWFYKMFLILILIDALTLQNPLIVLSSLLGLGVYTLIKQTNNAIRNSVVWFSAIAFGAAQLFVIGNDYWNIIHILPFVAFGLFASYLRIKFGFWYAFLFHASNNFLVLIVKSFLQEVVKNTNSLKAFTSFIMDGYLSTYDPLLISFLVLTNFLSALSFSVVLYLLVFRLSIFGKLNKPLKYVSGIIIIGLLTVLISYNISEDKRLTQILELENYALKLQEGNN